MHPVVRALMAGAKAIIKYYTNGTENVTWSQGAINGTGTAAKNADHLFIQALTGDNGYITMVTNAVVDLTNINTLNFDIEATVTGGGVNTTIAVGAGTSRTDFNFTAARSSAVSVSRQVISVDVSALTGGYYIKLQSSRQNQADQTSILKVFQVWGE
jgi:hypothetical protein